MEHKEHDKEHEHEHHKEHEAHKKETVKFEMKKERIWQGLSAILGIIIIVMFFTKSWGSNQAIPAQGTGAPAQQQQQQGKVNFDIPSFAPFKGSDSAKVNIIEFGDYQCPFCERFFTQAEPQILKDYVNTGKAKFYFLDFAFLGPDSATLAEGAWCANEQNKYYDYHDYVYSNQGQENSGWATPDKVKALVADIPGLDVQKFGSCLDSGKYQSRVDDMTSLGQASGVRGTPSVFIGNTKDGYQLLVGAQPYQAFKQVIDAELSG